MKYSCILCVRRICNRPEDDEIENDDIDGWVANKSVAYCRDCNFQPGETVEFGFYFTESKREDISWHSKSISKALL